MNLDWMKIPYSLLTLFIVFNYGLLLNALIAKIAARVGRRHGIPIWQNYVDLIKNYGLRTSISHGVHFYLGPVFRLTGGIGLVLFVPTLYGNEMFANLSFAGDLILALYFVFFGTLGMALGANPHTCSGLTGMWDLILTCTGSLSRNYTVGKKLGEGMTLGDILASMRMVAEGVKTAKSVFNLSNKCDVEMPICHEVEPDFREVESGRWVACHLY